MISAMLSINLTLTLMFSMMKHPLSMGSILLLQTLMVALITGNMNQSLWFSYILFLIMIGGMLILFMYMTSIASNEKFKTNIKLLPMIMIIPTATLMIQPYQKSMILNNENQQLDKSIELMSTLNKFMNTPLTLTFLFMMIYLLLALIATVKITNFKQGSIRQMN